MKPVAVSNAVIESKKCCVVVNFSALGQVVTVSL